MAPSATLKYWCFLIALLSTRSCFGQGQSGFSIVYKAMLCFNNTTIYKNCLQQNRLNPNGTMNVTSNATNFCDRPCMAATQFLLGCVDDILSNFQFYNRATMQAVNSTLLMACGNPNGGGDFNTSKSTDTVAGNHGLTAGIHSSLWVTCLVLLLTIV